MRTSVVTIEGLQIADLRFQISKLLLDWQSTST